MALHGSEKIYLRDYELKWRRQDSRDHAIGETEGILHECLLNGHRLVLAVDEMPTPERQKEWRELYDPDLGHLINPHGGHPLPHQVLKPQDLNNADLLVKLGLIPTHDLPQ